MSTDLDISSTMAVVAAPAIKEPLASAPPEKPLAEILPQAGWQPVNVREMVDLSYLPR